jgi:hypothetical protein
MNEHTADYARWRGYACVDPPESRVAAAVRIYTHKPIGLKYYSENEQAALFQAILGLSADDRRKVRLVASVRPSAR